MDTSCLLARAQLRVLSYDFNDDFDWDYVSPGGLGSEEALTIATKWSEKLQGHVGFTTDCIEVRLGCGSKTKAWIPLSLREKR